METRSALNVLRGLFCAALPQFCASWSSCVWSGWMQPCSKRAGRDRLSGPEPARSPAYCRSPSQPLHAWYQPSAPWPEHKHTHIHTLKSVTWDLLWWNSCSYGKVTTARFYLEVGADLHQHPPCNSDIVGGHQLPLEDGERNVRARGQIRVCDWLQGHWRSRGAVCLGVTLERHNLHVRQSLSRKKESQGKCQHKGREQSCIRAKTLPPHYFVASHKYLKISQELGSKFSLLQQFSVSLSLTLFPYCWTWLVFVWLFTILNCFTKVSLVRSSWKHKKTTTT